MGKGFSDFTYGVGLNVNASSFKQVKDALKVNLDNLSKMVKSYGKVLKIDPDADLSKLFAQVREMQSIVSGINGSNNSFAGFVDKGVLTRISALETSLESVASTSKTVETNLSGLRASIDAITGSLKDAGQIKFPATFDNLFGDIKDQSSEIKKTEEELNRLVSLMNKVKTSKNSIAAANDKSLKKGIGIDSVKTWLAEFATLQDELKRSSNLNFDQLQEKVLQLSNVSAKLTAAQNTFTDADFSSAGLTKQINQFNNSSKFITKQLDSLISDISQKRQQLQAQLDGLRADQSKFDAQNIGKSSTAKSLGLQSDVTAQVKILPKTNDAEWANKINDTIANIEPNLKPVMLRPTFSKGKSIEREVDGNLAQVNHAVNIDLQVNDNLEEFNQRIKNVDASIKNAKQQLEQNGNFKIRFEYEEGGKFKDAAYKIINKFKKIDASFYITNGKKFIQDVARLRDKSKNELTNMPANIIVGNQDAVISSVDMLRAEIDKKIGNIGINLNIQNIPQVVAQAAAVRDAIGSAYDGGHIGAMTTPNMSDTGVESATKGVENLSDAAKKANEDLIKCRGILKSLTESGFNAPEFLQLGDIDSQGRKIKDSTKKIEALLNRYRELQAKLPDDVSSRWNELYPEANGDMATASKMAKEVQAELKQVESELSLYLQKQVAYTQNRYEQAQKTLQVEKEVAAARREQTSTATGETSAHQMNNKLAMSAEDAAKKIRSLNGTITQQKRVLADLEANGFKSSSFARLGEWDKESGSFKKNKQYIQELINKYNELYNARIKSGGTKAVGEEASVRGKLSAILREQKKHVSEIISQNQAELQSVRQISNAYKEADTGRNKTQNNTGITASTKEIDLLISKLNEARAALELLKSKKFDALSSTGLGDVNKRLSSVGSNQSLSDLINEYNTLIAKRNQLEKSGASITSPEYIAYAKQFQGVEQQLNVIYNDQLKYTQNRIKDYKTQISQAQQLLQLEQQQTKENAKQEAQTGTNTNVATTVDPAKQTSSSSIVKLDGATLHSIAQDSTLKAIDGKINGILQQLGRGITITGANVSISANGVTVSGGASSGNVVMSNPAVRMNGVNLTDKIDIGSLKGQLSDIVNNAKQQGYKEAQYKINYDRGSNNITGATVSYISQDGLNRITEYYGLVKKSKDAVAEFAYTHSTLTENIEQYEKALISAGKAQDNLMIRYDKELSSLQGALDPNASRTLSGTQYESAVKSKISELRSEVAKLDQYADGKRVLLSTEELAEQQRLIELILQETKDLISQSKNAQYPAGNNLNKEANIADINKYLTQITAFEEQMKRSGTYTEQFGLKIQNLKTQLNSVKTVGDLDTFKFDFDSLKAEGEQLKTFISLYNDLIESKSKQMQLEHQIKNSTIGTKDAERELAVEKEISNSLETQLSQYGELYNQQAQQAALAEARKRAEQEIAKTVATQSDKNVNEKNKKLLTAINKAQSEYDSMYASMNNMQLPASDSAIQKLNQYKQLLAELRAEQQRLATSPELFNNESYRSSFDGILAKIKSVKSELSSMYNSSSSFFKNIKDVNDVKLLGEDFDPSNINQMHTAMTNFANQVGVGKASLIGFNDVQRTASFEVRTAKGEIQQLTVAYDQSTNSLGRWVSRTTQATSELQRFLGSFKQSWQNVARYLTTFGSVYQLYYLIRQGITYVKEIDDALTELKKVTDAAEASYDNFLSTMSKSAGKLGTTVKDLTSSAADWARLGYSIKEASALAENTSILMNVSEFEDVNKATDSLISSLQAYKTEGADVAKFSMEIIDKYNEVGNNYAISTSDLAESLTRSSSALVAANNSLEESIAMTAAANTTIQDPESVGNALKVVSMRIRGTKTELEEAGEDTEGMVENTAKLQEKIMALTNIDGSGGIDILTNSGEFKSTYQILLEISKIWEEMDDMSQAALLELVAGKTRGSVVAALFQNGDVLEEAYASASEASGSAMRELDTHLNSVQGRLDVFMNSWQTLWMDTVSSDFMKGILDIGTGLVDLVRDLGLVKTLLGAVAGYFIIIKKHSPTAIFGELFRNLRVSGNVASITSMLGGNIGSMSMESFKTGPINAYAAAVSNLTYQKQAATLATAGLNEEQIRETLSQNGATEADINQIMTEGQLTDQKIRSKTATVASALAIEGEEAAKLSSSAATWLQINGEKQLTYELVDEAVKHGIITAEVGAEIIAKYGLVAANNKVTFSFKKLWAAMQAGFLTNPVGWILGIVSVISIISSVAQTAEEKIDDTISKAQELRNEYKTTIDTLSGNVRTVNGFEDEFTELAKGVDEYGKNISLAEEDYDRYLEIVSSVVEMSPKIVEAYDSEGNAIVKKNDLLKETIELLEKEQQAEAKKMAQSANFKTTIEGLSAEVAQAPSKAKTKSDFAQRTYDIFTKDNVQWYNWIFGHAAEGGSGIMTLLNNAGISSDFDAGTFATISSIPVLGSLAGRFSDWLSKDDLISLMEENATQLLEYMLDNESKIVGEWFTQEQYDELLGYLTDYNNADPLREAVKAYQDEYTNALMPIALSSDQYWDLDEQGRAFIKSYINAAFPIPEDGDLTKNYNEVKDKITSFMTNLPVEDIQPLIPIGTNLGLGMDENGNPLTVNEYLKQVDEFTKQVKSLGLSDEITESIFDAFGLDGATQTGGRISQKFGDAASHVRKILGDEWEKAKGIFTTDDIILAYKILPDVNPMPFDKFKFQIDEYKKGQGFDVSSAKTYSAIVEEIESYNDILSQTSEIISDNTEVTQEYKDALVELGISKSELDEYFYEGNPLVVKNAKGLNDLVKSAKKNTAQNIKLAKSHARLEYYELYKEMKKLTNGTEVIDYVTRDYIDSLYDQMTALQGTIAKYSLLEAELLGAANAYQELEDAQAADEAMDYGSKAEELVNVLADAFNTAQLGTEAARVAIEGLIPDDVIDKSLTFDEQMEQIHEYFTEGTLSKLFKIEYDDDGVIQSVEMTKEKVEEFTNSLIGTDEDSVFQGSWDRFTLNPAIETLDDFAEKIGTTKEVAFAYLTELERYDISNVLGSGGETLLDQLMGDNFDYKLQKAVKAAADVEKKLAEGKLKITDEEYTNAIYNLEAQEESAMKNAAAWAEKNEAINSAKENLSNLQKQLKEAYGKGDTSELESQIGAVSEEIDVLYDDLKKLEEPTEFTLQVAMDEAKENIEDFKEDIKELADTGDDQSIKINTFIEKIDKEGLDGLEEMGFIKHSDGTWRGSFSIEGWSTLDPASKGAVLEYINMLEDEHYIDLLMGGDTPTVEQHLGSIAKILEDIAKILDPTYTLTVETSEAESNVATFKSMWDGIKDKSVTLTQNVAQTVKGIFTRTPKESDVNGTANAAGTAYKGGSWGAPRTETALTGELGPEMVVRGNKWHLVGENGAEFTQVKRGDIIFNHKQTAELLKNGHVAGRGKAYAGGTNKTSGSAYAYTIGTTAKENEDLLKSLGITKKTTSASSTTSITNATSTSVFDTLTTAIDTFDDYYKKGDNSDEKGGSGKSDKSDEDKEVFDWIEVRLEELEEILGKLNAELENTVGYSAQNAKIDEIISINKKLRDNLLAGAEEYYRYSETLLAKVPEEYRAAAQDGTIAIESFAKDADEKTLEAIQDYREWVQKGADVTQQAEEVLTEISSLAKQAIDNIAADYENRHSLNDVKISQLEGYNDLLETDKGFAAEGIYEAIIKENESKLSSLAAQRDAMQAELNKRVDAGEIKKNSQDWYDAVNAIAEVDTAIIDLKVSNEDLQDSINELHWDKFDLLIKQFEAVSDEAENLLDVLGTRDAVDEFGNWTDDGITSLGLLAQQMEVAEMQAQQYKEEIEYLNKNWKKLGYTQEEYVDKLEELKSGQYDAIKAYNDTKDAIVDLNKERVDAIKDGIKKEIEAYEELIEKKKEELDAEKDLYDFQKGVASQQKEIADIERKLAALSGDNSASARAQRAKLEAELYEARQELQDQYYDRSITDQQEALDKELDNFKEEKDKEIEGWEKYLESVELVVSDSLAVVQANTDAVLETLAVMGQEFGLAITNALTDPWKAGTAAIQDYGAKLNVSLDVLVAMLGMTVDQFAAKIGMTTEELVGSLDITVAQMAEGLGLTNEQLAARLGLTVTNLNGMMDMTIQQLAANMGITLPILAEKLGTTTSGLVGNLDMTMTQFAGKIGLTVSELSNKFGFTAADLAKKLGMTYQDLANPFGLSMSATVDALKALETEYSNILASITGDSQIAVNEVNKNMQKYQESKIPESAKPTNTPAQTTQNTIAVGSRINAGTARIYATSQGTGGGQQYFASDPIYTVLKEVGDYVLVRHHKLSNGYTGWFKKSDIKAYAKGTIGTKKDELAWIDELGEELRLVPGQNGRLAYIQKGTGIVPADLTSNLMEWGKLDPQDMLDRNRPAIAPNGGIFNTEIKIDASVGTLVNIEHCDQSTLPDVEKIVNKAFDKHMQNLNNSIKRFVR